MGRDGRAITERGIEELKNTLISRKIGLAVTMIDQLAYRVNFDFDKGTGTVPVTVSFFSNEVFTGLLKKMRFAFKARFCFSDMIAVLNEGEIIDDLVVPKGKTALAVVNPVMLNSAFIRAGIPVATRLSGLMRVIKYQPIFFTDLIYYNGCSVNPSELFIRAKMTSVNKAARTGQGEILVTYREIPSLSSSIAKDILYKLGEAGLGRVLYMGDANETVYEITPELNQIGIVMCTGSNILAVAEEVDIQISNYSPNAVIDYQRLVRYSDIFG